MWNSLCLILNLELLSPTALIWALTLLTISSYWECLLLKKKKKSTFEKNPRLRLTILKAVTTVVNVGSTIYNFRKILFISPFVLWGNFEKHQSKTCSESPGVKIGYDGKSRWSNHQQSSYICDWWEKEACVWSTTDGKCQLHHLKYYPHSHPTIWK